MAEEDKLSREPNGRFQRNPQADLSVAPLQNPSAPSASREGERLEEASFKPEQTPKSGAGGNLAADLPLEQSFVSSWGEEGRKGKNVIPPNPTTVIPDPSPVSVIIVPEPAVTQPANAASPTLSPSSPDQVTVSDASLSSESPEGPRLPPKEKEVLPSYFDGKPSECFGNFLLGAILSILTLGFALPWVYCRNVRWNCDHMVYEGKRLRFDGKGSQLLGKWVVWYLLCLITVGIYALLLPLKLEAWKVKHCYFE